ncbi:MAG TPA: NAD(+)/NADH kinase [Acidimicrobiales bacterium]
MASVALVVHPERPEAAKVALHLVEWLQDLGHTTWLPLDDAVRMGRTELGRSDEELCRELDLTVSLGGDGTMLRTDALVAETDDPVIGVNFGQLGYLTDVEPEGARQAIERFLAGQHRIEERMLLDVDVEAADVRQSRRHLVALNEAVLEKTASGHTVRLDVDLDGARFTPYAADGLIVATPTGSTAYAFSARGPIVEPTHRSLLLTPVSPHMLFDRTLVLNDDAEVRLTVAGQRPAALVVDGRSIGELQPGDVVRCRAAAHVARLVMSGPRDFHAILKAKFGLTDR